MIEYKLNPEQWARFIEYMRAPTVVKPELVKLFSEPSVLERAHKE